MSRARICSEHFSENDFEVDKVNRMLGLRERSVLKKGSVPTLKLPSGFQAAETDHNLKRRKMLANTNICKVEGTKY